MSLNNRCLKMLIQIASVHTPINITTMKETYKISERTIRYDIKEINDWLKQKQLGFIEVIYGKGFILEGGEDQRRVILELLDGKTPKDYYYSSEERQKILLLELLNSEEPLKTAYLQACLKISRGTVMKEIIFIEEWLRKYQLDLIKKPNYGIKIEGTETAKRNALLGLAKDFLTTEQILGIICNHEFDHKIYNKQNRLGLNNNPLFFSVDLNILEKSLNALQVMLGVRLGDNSFASLFTHLAIALQRIQAGKSIFLPTEDLLLLEKTDEFKTGEKFAEILEENFEIMIPKSEVGYITLHILAAQLGKPTEKDKKDGTASPESNNNFNVSLLFNNEEFDYMEMAKDITNFIKTQLNVEFHDENHMLVDLCIHLKPAVHRCKYKMYLTNPLLEDIRQNYYRLFLVVKEAILLLKIKYPIDMNDDELSYITLHFAAEIEKGKVQFNKKLNVLLVCASGLGTAKMLYNRISTNFSDLDILETVSYLDFFKRTDWPVDLVISTIELKRSQFPTILVNPLLKKENIEKIEAFMLEAHNQATSINTVNQSFRMIEGPQASLVDLLNEINIKLNVKVDNWQEAIIAGCELLYEQDSISDTYTKVILDNIKKLGPYIVIAPGIAFSHASHNKGVNKLGMSLIRLSEAVAFGHETNDPVKLIFTLAPIDKTSHYNALTTLMELLLNQRDLNILFNAPKVEDILELIKSKMD
ncbi:MAG: hypothetical protein CVV02_12760 [Firmicutes bacterium HGW-Firmicutes-7]|nr:MAG: hypothetical protein CVV02_12760 [Firmicutes bacterium HGW-Firmicutes-7]